MPLSGSAFHLAATAFLLVAPAWGSETEAETSPRRPRRAARPSCVVELTRDSLEFESASQGFVRVLTTLATSHGRRLHQKGAPKEFFLELVECLPKKARRDALAMLETVGLLDFDADNADANASALGRLLSAFRAIVMAWNGQSAADPIALRDLHTFEAATEAVERMGLAAALKERSRRPDIELFQHRKSGSYSVFVRLGTASRIAFTRDARLMFERLWRALPESTDTELRETARVAIAAIRDTDGSNATRQRDPADRILTAWKALAAAFAVTGDTSDGSDTIRMLETIGATRILEPTVAKFVRGKQSGLQYLRRVVRKKRGSSSATAVREFVVEAAEKFLPADALRSFRELVDALPWLRPPPRAARRSTQKSGAEVLRQQGNAPVRFSVRQPGDNESRCVYEAIALLVQMWNRAHEHDRTKQIDADAIHSPSALFRAFQAMHVEVEAPEDEPAPLQVVAPEKPKREFPELSELDPDRIVTADAPEPERQPEPVVVVEPEPEPVVVVEPEPEPEPTPVMTVVATPPAPAIGSRRETLRHFQSASGGLAYLRGLVRQFKVRYEAPHFLRDFIYDRTQSLPSPYRDTARAHLSQLSWKIDDPETAFTDEAVAERVLAAFEYLAGLWNESMPSSGAGTIATDLLATAQGMYLALLWLGPGSLEPAALGERAGSGYVHSGAPLPRYFTPPPTPRVVSPPPPIPRPIAPPPPPIPRPIAPPPPPPPRRQPATPPPRPVVPPTPPPKAKPTAPKVKRPTPPTPKPRTPRPEPEPMQAQRPSDPLDAIGTVDPEEPETAKPFFVALRAKLAGKRDGTTAEKLVGIFNRTAALPRNAQFRLMVLKAICEVAPPKLASVVAIFREGLKSQDEELQHAIAVAAATYDFGKDSTVRHNLTKLSARKDALGKAANAALASGN